MSTFKLSATLKGHTQDVRAVLLPDETLALTASRDGTTKLWKRNTPSPPIFEVDELSSGNQFKTCLAYLPPSKEYEQGLVISAGQDTLIEARQPANTAERNADAMMVGHTGQVCALDICPEAGWLVSGSWDGTAKLWEIGRWEANIELQGHTATVWAVLAYDRDTVVTGCADRAIRVFTTSGKLLGSWDGQDIVRALARFPDHHESGAQIVSAANDGVVRLWTLNGKEVAQLHGHESFVYSVCVLPSGEIVSSGEDRTVRIWQGTECVQVITLPAISVWSVSASPKGDFIVGSSDKIARIFSSDESRIADAATTAEFDEAVQSSAIPKSSVGELNTQDMPGPEFLTTKAGTKEGQTAIIKDETGAPTAYQWSMGTKSWIKIGQVVDSAGSGSKAEYKGKEYDYVFDVDIEEGKPPLKLPFNITQNPYDAATKFLQDNELPMSYLEETANFIIKNTQGATLGQQSQAEGADPWGTENRYRPGEQSSYQPKTAGGALPVRDYLAVTQGKPSQAMAQITKLNAEYSSSSPSLALSQQELQALSTLAATLDSRPPNSRPSISSSDIEPSVPALLKVIGTWTPVKNRLAGLDMLRFVAVATSSFPTDAELPELFSNNVFEGQVISTNNKLAMIGYRIYANLMYASLSGRRLIQKHTDQILQHVETGSKFINDKADANFAIALTTLTLNLAVLITSDIQQSTPEVAAASGVQLLETTTRILSNLPRIDHAGSNPLGQTTEPAYRALMTLGTILAGLRNRDIKAAATNVFGINDVLFGLGRKGFLTEARFERGVGEVRGALR